MRMAVTGHPGCAAGLSWALGSRRQPARPGTQPRSDAYQGAVELPMNPWDVVYFHAMKNAQLTIRSDTEEMRLEADLDELRGEVDRVLDRIVPAACADGTLKISLGGAPPPAPAPPPPPPETFWKTIVARGHGVGLGRRSRHGGHSTRPTVEGPRRLSNRSTGGEGCPPGGSRGRISPRGGSVDLQGGVEDELAPQGP